jgi:hypothetical protein
MPRRFHFPHRLGKAQFAGRLIVGIKFTNELTGVLDDVIVKS